jgi:ectoine hydroxylase-related dioxygenase (phytanoyl-CoA dioxygenase family)
MLNKPFSKQLIDQWKNNGWVIIKKAVSEQLINSLLNDLHEFRNKCNETKDEYGFGKRICQFHLINENSLQVALNPEIQGLLSFFFSSQPVLFGSLSFEVGTEEEAHSDNIFSYTRPKNSMVGVWIALEDVNPNAGPLFYYDSSHKWPEISAESILRRYPEMNPTRNKIRLGKVNESEKFDFVNLMEARWQDLLAEKIALLNAKPQLVLIEKGDVMIWHGLLVHGGLPRLDRSLTRKSMAAHFISKNCSFYDENQYFLMNQSEFSSTGNIPFSLRNSRFGTYCQHEQPVTY